MRRRGSRIIKPNSTAEITADLVRELLEYNPNTGELIIRIRNAGCIGKNGYRMVSVAGRQVLAHRLAWLLTYGEWPKHTVDHVNGDRSDNRLCNLREADWSENLFNSGLQCRNKSGVKGVRQSGQKWLARITQRGNVFWLGSFEKKEDAVRARKDAEARLHGKFARKS